MKPLKQFERYLSAIFSLGRIKGLAKEAHRGLTDVQPRVDQLERRLSEIGTGGAQATQELAEASAARMNGMERRTDGIEAQVKKLLEWMYQQDRVAEDLVADYRRESDTMRRLARADTAMLARMFSALSNRLDAAPLDQVSLSASTAISDAPDLPAAAGFDLFKESFYQRLDSQLAGAGTPDHLANYLPDIKAAWTRTDQKPVMDLGCGRGTWLKLLADHDITGFGIDESTAQIEEAQKQGLNAQQGDMLKALSEMKDSSLSALTARHLITRLPFEATAWIAREAMRVLAPGGVLIFETPNIENLQVAVGFQADPRGRRPFSGTVLEVLFETAGFDPIERRILNPDTRYGAFLARPEADEDLAWLMFGPQDLAILGSKPQDS